MNRITLGNLFSGSGTWELAAEICGITPVWEAEIEDFPQRVEAKRFPNCRQLGDVSEINGAEIEPVDIFTNSSPCQDLSIAGKRAGLAGERSGLFNEAIRITEEMRDADKNKEAYYTHPRFWCWENVPGAFSSNKGEDFKYVLESIAKIVEEKDLDIPIPEGGWHYAGVLEGERWQIAWRTMDAQFYGVPQRRRRIFLVADLAGHCASEVLFKPESVPWNFAEIREAWEATSKSLEDRIGEAGRIIRRKYGE